MKMIKVGLIGTGFMGKAHAIAFHGAPVVFQLSAGIELEMVAETGMDLARQKAAELHFNRYTDDWRTLVNDPGIDVVDICSPNYLHKEMALAAIAAGKHVYCEKPLALTAEDGLKMTLAAEAAGVKTLVGFNYAKNPTIQLAREIIAGGEIGKVVHFRGTHNEDYLRDPKTPHSWRLTRELAGSGTLGDMGAHIVNMAMYLVGDIVEIAADMQTVHSRRPQPGSPNSLATVENDDQVHMMVRFTNEAMGTLESSRIAWGRKNSLWFEVTGSRGSIIYDQERSSELQLFTDDQQSSREGFKRILLGAEHPDYGQFCVASGHGLGFNDQKTVEVRDLVEGIVAGRTMWPQFRDAYKVSRVLDGAELAHSQHRWVTLTEVDEK
jgi:predicted dehydrogenase